MEDPHGMARRRGVGRGRPLSGLAALALAAALSPGQAQAQAADPDRGYATQPFTPKTFAMPEGEGCAGDVARWKAVQDNDYASGNIGLKVFHQIEAEIARAQATCAAGHDRESQAMVRGSKRRHGYPG